MDKKYDFTEKIKLAEELFKKGDFNKADKIYKDLFKYKNYTYELLISCALFNKNIKRYKIAQDLLTLSIRKYPGGIKSYLLLSEIYTFHKNFKEAEKLLFTAQKIDKTNSFVYYKLAIIYFANKNYESAIKFIDIASYIEDALAAHKKYIASQKSVQALSESFRYTEEKYNVELVSTYEYNDAKNRLFQVEADFLQAKYDYIFKIKILDFYTGNELTF